MRRRLVLAEQLEPRLVLSVVGLRGVPVRLSDAPSSDQAPDESNDSSTSDSSESSRTDESTSPAGTATVAVNSSSDDETTSQRTTTDSRPTTTFKTSATQIDATATDRDTSTSDATGDTADADFAKQPTRRLPASDLPTKPRVIVLRRDEVADDIDEDVTNEEAASNFGIPRPEVEVESYDLASLVSLPKDNIDFLEIATHASGQTLDAAKFTVGETEKTVDAVVTAPPTMEVIQHDGWFDRLVMSLATWLHDDESTSFLNDAAHQAQMPFFALAGAFTFASVARKGTEDANKLFRPMADERFESIGRRWWRDRRRLETGSRSGRSSPRRASGTSVPSQFPVSDSPLTQPDISDAFVMSLMNSVESDAFVMSPLQPDDHSSEEDSQWSPSIKVAIAGAAIGGTFAAGNALSQRRDSTGKRTARPIVRYTGTTVVPQSSLPQAARS